MAVLWGKSVVTGVSGLFKPSQVGEASKDNVAPPWTASGRQPPPQQQQIPPAISVPAADQIFPQASQEAASSEGRFLVSVSSQLTETEAQASFQAMQKKYPDQLGSRSPVIKRYDAKNGVYYRAMVGPFASREGATRFCDNYEAVGGQCLGVLPASSVATGAPAPEPIAPVAQRVVLYDEDPSDPKGKHYVGSVVWRAEPIKASGNQRPDIAVRADIDIPDRKFKMTMSFRRNTDSSLPASHTAELTFILPQDFSGGGVANVPGILMRSNLQARGTLLAGLAVKVADGFFLVGLSNVGANRAQHRAFGGALLVRHTAGLRQPASCHHRDRKGRTG